MNTLTTIIKNTREQYVLEGYVPDYRSINNGACAEFAEAVEHEYGGPSEVVSTDDFMLKLDDGWNGDGHDAWDETTLAQYHSAPPNGLQVRDLEHFIHGYHVWIYADGLHYDSECPEGTANLFDLPFYSSVLRVKTAMEEALKSDSVDGVLAKHSIDPLRWTGECEPLNGIHIGVLARGLYKYFDEVQKKKLMVAHEML